jgi:hypothetical protein
MSFPIKLYTFTSEKTSRVNQKNSPFRGPAWIPDAGVIHDRKPACNKSEHAKPARQWKRQRCAKFSSFCIPPWLSPPAKLCLWKHRNRSSAKGSWQRERLHQHCVCIFLGARSRAYVCALCVLPGRRQRKRERQESLPARSSTAAEAICMLKLL